MAHKFVIIGRVGAAHGLQGWSRIFSHTEPWENLLEYQPIYLLIDGAWQEISIVESRLQGKNIVARFADCNDREQAAKLVNLPIGITRSQLPKLAEDEFYWADLENLRVVNQQGIDFGKVDRLFATGSNDVLVVENDEKQRMIPYIMHDVIKKIDLENRRIDVDWDSDF